MDVARTRTSRPRPPPGGVAVTTQADPIDETGQDADRTERVSDSSGADVSASELSVLAVTAFRPNEMYTSVSEMDANTTVVALDADDGLGRRMLTTVRETWRALRTEDPDVLLLDCYETMGFLVTLLSLLAGVPVVARLVGDTWRILEEEGLQSARENRAPLRYVRYRLSLLLNAFVFAKADGFVVVSKALKEVVHERTGRPRERIAVVPVPLTRRMSSVGSASAARDALGIGEERVVLSVSNFLYEAKVAGAETIVQELETVLGEESDLALVLAGGGPYHDRLRSFLEDAIDDPETRRRVYAPGQVDGIADLYALADVFVYVSHLDGYPRVVLEAQAATLPVVANDALGMRDQITDGETGYLIDPASPGELRNRVRSLLAEPTERDRLGANARWRVDHENAADTVGAQLQSFLSEFV